MTVNLNSLGTEESTFCGNATTTAVNVYLYPNTNCNGGVNASHSTLENVIAHELGHAIGFNNGEHSGQYEGVSDHCTMHLPADYTMNSGLCRHEIEKVFAAYGMGDPTAIVTDFYSLHILTGLSVTPDPATVQAGASIPLTVTALLSLNAHPSFVTPGTSGVTYGWEAQNPSVATVSGLGVVSGQNQGITKVAGRIIGGIPAGTLVGGLFQTAGSPITVNVTPGIWCGDPSCTTITQGFGSHFTGAGCTGKESYYTPYFNNDGIRRSWNGSGRAGTTLRTVTNRSFKYPNGTCDTAWPNGNTLSGFVTVYRAVCGEATCALVNGQNTSRYTGTSCNGQELSLQAATRGTWDGGGIIGTAQLGSTATYSSRPVNGACNPGTIFLPTYVSNAVKVYR